MTGVQKLGAYIGHSQGTTIFFASLATDPSFADNFRSYVALAPITYITHQGSLLITTLADANILNMMKLVGVKTFAFDSTDPVSPITGKMAASAPNWYNEILKEVAGGGRNSAIGNDRFVVMASHFPGGTSMKNAMHWEQIFKSKTF